MLVISIAACLSGAVCGDHCSPISDTTIMASAGHNGGCGAGAECGRDDLPQGRDDPRQKGKRMTPIPFREQNITYNPPEGMEDKCDALPAFRGEGQVISCWHLTLWERIKLLLTGRLWFSVIGNGQPPIWLGVDCPFIRK